MSEAANIELSISAATAVRSVLVQLQNASGTSFNVNSFALSAGVWDPAMQPTLGQAFDPGAVLTYRNFTDQPFSDVGGQVELAPVTGGTVTIGWLWTYGSPLKSGIDIQLTGLYYRLVVGNQTTTEPMMQVMVSSFATFRAEESPDG